MSRARAHCTHSERHVHIVGKMMICRSKLKHMAETLCGQSWNWILASSIRSWCLIAWSTQGLGNWKTGGTKLRSPGKCFCVVRQTGPLFQRILSPPSSGKRRASSVNKSLPNVGTYQRNYTTSHSGRPWRSPLSEYQLSHRTKFLIHSYRNKRNNLVSLFRYVKRQHCNINNEN